MKARPDEKSKKRGRSRKATAASEPAPKFTPWDAPATLAAVEQATAKCASDWHFIAATTQDFVHTTARAKSAILDAVTRGDPACLRDLAGRATKHMARMGRASDVAFSATSSAAFDQFHFSIVLLLLAPIPSNLVPEGGLTAASVTAAIPIVGMRNPPFTTEAIARDMVTWGRHLPEIRHMLARHCPELFPLTGLSAPVPNAWLAKIVAALDRVRGVSDVNEAAEKMIVQFLLTVGVPSPKARAVWDYRNKAVKRGGKRRTVAKIRRNS